MLCTEGRPGFLPLVVYADDELLEPRHVLEVATRYVYESSTESRSVERGERQSRTVLPPLHASALAHTPALVSPAHIFFLFSSRRATNLGIFCRPSSLKSSQLSRVVLAV
jgi:hypothetical protein